MTTATRIDVYPKFGGAAASYCVWPGIDGAAAAALLSDPVIEAAVVDGPPPATLDGFNVAVDVHFLPGVTDNRAQTARETLLAAGLIDGSHRVHSGAIHFTAAGGAGRYNPLIERADERDATSFLANGFGPFGTDVKLSGGQGAAVEVDLDLDDAGLLELSAKGVLGLNLDDMHAIKAHYEKLGRKPTDIELETLAQSWSEHCKHRIFAARIDDDEGLETGLFREYIARATFEIMDRPDKQGFCLSVFGDNAGAIAFDDDWMVSDKVETHNSPSLLDPFGGAMTGVVGVNRDCLGFGLGAKPIANRYGFCFARPDDDSRLYRDAALSNEILSGATIASGVVAGIEAGGNHSGIPTAQGFVIHDASYRGKPLVFCGTVGLLPRKITTPDGRTLAPEQKSAQVGDRIVVAGGRVGADGIHGATFSSVELDENSPATAVQIGDPITQKRMSDCLVRELRDQGLYSAITDNGAGGLSSSIGEMATNTGGAVVELDRVPLKYPGLQPWEIWISESQERMSLAVPPQHVDEVIATFAKRGVEATDIGTFTGDGNLTLRWNGEALGTLSMDFLHEGAPRKVLVATQPVAPDVDPVAIDFQTAATKLLDSPNISSRVDVAELFDHEVQASSVIKPLQGTGRERGDATVIAPVVGSGKGVGMSHAVFPWLTERAPHAAATRAVDQAVRNLVAVGVNPHKIALQDNFCWCSGEEPERVWQLKQAARGCYDGAVHFGAPYISGKDSMFNDFKGFDASGAAVKVSALPTLLISSIGIADDVANTQTMDFKAAGDLILQIGANIAGLGGTLLEAEVGKAWPVPSKEVLTEMGLLEDYAAALDEGLLASSCAVGVGGTFWALNRCMRAGGFSAQLFVPPTLEHFAEGGGRFLISCQEAHVDDLLNRFEDAEVIGEVVDAR